MNFNRESSRSGALRKSALAAVLVAGFAVAPALAANGNNTGYDGYLKNQSVDKKARDAGGGNGFDGYSKVAQNSNGGFDGYTKKTWVAAPSRPPSSCVRACPTACV